MAEGLIRATFEVSEESLQQMVLDRDQLPLEFREFQLFREGVLDNATMVEQGLPGNTAESLRQRGRITGYMREFISPASADSLREGDDVAVATVAHLFDDQEAVSAWVTEVFVKQLQDNLGKSTVPGQKLVSAERVEVQGFHDEAVAMATVQEGSNGLVSATVLDFRVGRLLGVAFVVTAGTVQRREMVEHLGADLERQIVRVVLGTG